MKVNIAPNSNNKNKKKGQLYERPPVLFIAIIIVWSFVQEEIIVGPNIFFPFSNLSLLWLCKYKLVNLITSPDVIKILINKF